MSQSSMCGSPIPVPQSGQVVSLFKGNTPMSQNTMVAQAPMPPTASTRYAMRAKYGVMSNKEHQSSRGCSTTRKSRSGRQSGRTSYEESLVKVFLIVAMNSKAVPGVDQAEETGRLRNSIRSVAHPEKLLFTR